MLKSLHKYRLVYTHLWQTYGQTWQVRFAFVLQIISRVCKLIALPVATSIIITELSRQNYSAAYRGVWLFASFSLLLGIISPVVKYIGMLGENRVYDKLTGDYFEKLISADIGYFNENLSGYLTTATRQYGDATISLVRAIRDTYLNTALSILFPLIVIGMLDWQLGLITLCLSLLQAFYLLWASHIITPHRAYVRELYKKNSGHMADAISNILAVRSNAQEKVYARKVRENAKLEGKAYNKRYALQSKLIALRECITVSFFLTLLWFTVQRMSSGSIPISTAVLVITYLTTILNGIYSLSDNLDEHDDYVDKILPAFDILTRTNTIKDPESPKKFAGVKGDIHFQSVSFAYDSDPHKVLKDFKVHIPAGQKIGIVGLSGAGKSTLTKLLLRFEDVSSGSILVDNIDIRAIKQADLRSHIAYVPQEPLLFHSSIKNNVLVGRSDASEAEIVHALKTAHAYEFITKLPIGINSIVGERGVKLSGGQKQRIAIARAVLRGAPIMILDEATSALDSESEEIIKASFKEILKDKTAIVVAHRLSTLSEMDRIIVIEKGTCVEDGTHQELLKSEGVYASLWRRQRHHDLTTP